METFLGEEFEAASLHPVAHERVSARVTFVTIRQAFLEDFAELRLQREDVPDAWRARIHPFGLLLSKFEEIEVIAAIFLFLSTRKSLFGNGEEGETWRKRERFLRAGEHQVDAERVHVDLHRGKRRDRIDDQNDVGIFCERAANLRQRIHYAG